MHQLVLQIPEAPIKEEWLWLTDLQTSFDGNEDRIPLNRYPKRALSGTYEFDRVADLRRHLSMMQTTFKGGFRSPLFQHQVKLKSAIDPGSLSIPVNAIRSDFRVGRLALVIEGDIYEERVVEAITANLVTFDTPLVNGYSARALACPIAEVYSQTGAGVTRRNADGSASASFRLLEYAPWAPLVSPLSEQALTMLDDFAILDRIATGSQFESAIDTGILIAEYIGLPDIQSPWDQAQWVFPLRFLVNRTLDPTEWHWWQMFADWVQGSSNPFLLPTGRADLEFLPAGTIPGLVDVPDQLIVNGNEYSANYWPLDTFKHIFIDSAAGRHYATVTEVNQTGIPGKDRLVFDPPHPETADWFAIERVGFLLKARISDDKITCDHYGSHTEVTVALRTVA